MRLDTCMNSGCSTAITRVQFAPFAHALQIQTIFRASGGIAFKIDSEMVTLVHQHGVESVASPQPLGLPQSGQILEDAGSLPTTALADALITPTSRFSASLIY
jgi:hypothetical protein